MSPLAYMQSIFEGYECGTLSFHEDNACNLTSLKTALG